MYPSTGTGSFFSDKRWPIGTLSPPLLKDSISYYHLHIFWEVSTALDFHTTPQMPFNSSCLFFSSPLPSPSTPGPPVPIPHLPACPQSTHKIYFISPYQGDPYAPQSLSSILDDVLIDQRLIQSSSEKLPSAADGNK